MKTPLLLIAFTVFATSAFSQLDKTYGTKLGKPSQKKPAIKLNQNQLFQDKTPLTITVQPDNSMPVLKLASEGKVSHNNGRGADVYVYSPDNMPVLKPDQMFKSNMPVAGRNPLLIKP